MRTFSSLADFAAATGEDLGYSDWHEVTQAQVSAFADATGDHQWIHVDPQRAASGPFGKTIAHGYLTLAMLPVLVSEIYRIENLTMAVNYGLDRLRFPSPVPTGSRIRAGATLREVKETSLGQLAYSRVTVEVEGHEKAACVADTVTLFVG
ncbi:MAG TPA: MaoC family dehydratase [Streptosporangiaceae bacterium]